MAPFVTQVKRALQIVGDAVFKFRPGKKITVGRAGLAGFQAEPLLGFALALAIDVGGVEREEGLVIASGGAAAGDQKAGQGKSRQSVAAHRLG